MSGHSERKTQLCLADHLVPGDEDTPDVAVVSKVDELAQHVLERVVTVHIDRRADDRRVDDDCIKVLTH